MTDQMNSDRAEILYASFPAYYLRLDKIMAKTHEQFWIWHGDAFFAPHTVRAAPHALRAGGDVVRPI